jgi:hypothetical protein
MQWSKLRLTFLERLAPELRSRLDIHMAKYPSGGRGWLTFDGTEVIAVQAPGFTRKIFGHSMCAELMNGQTAELGSAVFEALNMPIEDALRSSNDMVQGLSVVDARCGQRRLATIDAATLTSFPAAMLALRRYAGGRRPNPIRCEFCGEAIASEQLLGETRSSKQLDSQ